MSFFENGVRLFSTRFALLTAVLEDLPITSYPAEIDELI